MTGWTEDRVETLKAMWADGRSAAEIARTLKGPSRAAVIGKIHRLGLSGEGRSPAAEPRAYKAPPAAPKSKPPRVAFTAAGETVPAPPPLPPAYSAKAGAFRSLSGSEPLQLEQLRPRHCRWPIDAEDGQTLFCCLSARDGQVYCATHAAMAVNPTQPKERTGNQLARALRRWVA